MLELVVDSLVSGAGTGGLPSIEKQHIVSVEITCNRYIHFFEGDIDDTLRQAVGA